MSRLSGWVVTLVQGVCERSVILMISVAVTPLLLFAPSLTRQMAKPVGRANEN